MVKVTIEDQIVSDFGAYAELTDKILGRMKARTMRHVKAYDYLLLLEMVMEHAQWVIESYPVVSDAVKTEMRAV